MVNTLWQFYWKFLTWDRHSTFHLYLIALKFHAMGHQASKMMKKGMDYIAGNTAEDGGTNSLDQRLASFRGTPFVLKRTGSQYFDEDGHLAHEFYTEIRDKKVAGRVRLRRISKGLRKQGEIQLDLPRLNCNFPIVIYEG